MKRNLFVSFLLGISILSSSCQSNSSKHSNVSRDAGHTIGKVIGIIDGDTYDLLIEGNKTIRIRMDGIDAPERGMPFYKVSKNYLAKLCFKQQVRFKAEGKDVHNRNLGFTYLGDGSEVGHLMVKAGMAWHFKKYNSEKELANLEIEARNARRGLWYDENPMAPWENRKLHRQGISTKGSFNIQPGQE